MDQFAHFDSVILKAGEGLEVGEDSSWDGILESGD